MMDEDSPVVSAVETLSDFQPSPQNQERVVDYPDQQQEFNDPVIGAAEEITVVSSKVIPGKSSSSAKLSSGNNGQVVKLPPISDSGKYRNMKAAMNAPGGSAKISASKAHNGSNNSSVSTQVTVASNQSKSHGSTVPRNTFPSDSSSPTKSRQPSINRSSLSNSSGASQLTSSTGPLSEMKVASMKMQMAQKKVVPKSVSVSSGHPIGGSYRYKIMPGNNSRVVMTAMRKRPWWHAILGNNAAEAEDQNDLSAIQPTFLWEMIRRACRYRTSQFHNTLMNHIQRNNCLVTKKGLYLSLKVYCDEHNLDLLSIVPRTYYLAPGEHSKSMKDDDMDDFLNYCNNVPGKKPEELVWILKPASRTNRGFGIKVVQGLERVMNIVQRGMSANSTEGRECGGGGGEESGEDDDEEDGGNAGAVVASAVASTGGMSAFEANPLNKQAKMIARTDGYIVQAYLERPLLVHQRKFDIRCFVLVTVLPLRRHATSSSIAPLAVSTELGEDDAQAVATVAAAVEDQLHNSATATTRTNNSIAKKSSVSNSNTPMSPGKQRPTPSVNASKAVTNTRSTGREKEVRAYFFQEAYIRTSCKKYVNANFSDRETHLTNDAVQKHAKSYGQFEEGNKLSLQEWEQVLLEEYPDISRPGIVMDQIFPEIKRLSKISIASVAQEFAVTDIHKSFELFGYDYMIREDLSPVLIEVNTNPCLEFVCPLLTQVITDVIEHTVRMTVDKELPPPPKATRTKAAEEAIAAINSSPIKFDALYP